MRDFPVFTTQFGVASLVLREVPYTGRAYITLQSTLEPEALIQECVEFCVAVGAEEIFGSGHGYLEKFPFHTSVLKLQCDCEVLGDTDALLWPVNSDTMERWRELYNQKSTRIPNGAYLSQRELIKLLTDSCAYFVHRDHKLIGTGLVSRDEILWVSSVAAGMGADVVRALVHGITSETVTLEVASENKKAIDLYQRLGFVVIEERSRWYRIR